MVSSTFAKIIKFLSLDVHGAFRVKEFEFRHIFTPKHEKIPVK